MPSEDARQRGVSPTPGLRVAIQGGGEDCVSQAAGPMGRSTPGRRSRTAIAAASGVAALGLVFWVLSGGPGPAAPRSLPPQERAALAQRTLANLREVCHLPDRPREFCREQASLLLGLRECGDSCRADAQAVLAADLAVR